MPGHTDGEACCRSTASPATRSTASAPWPSKGCLHAPGDPGACRYRSGAAGVDSSAYQPDHPRNGCAVSYQPIDGRPHHPPPGAGAGQSTASRPRRQYPSVDHRWHPDPRPRRIDHRHQQELPAQHQHPNHHLRAPAPRGDRRAVLARKPRRTSSSPVQQSHTCSPASARSSVTAATAASTRSPHQHETSPAGSSAAITAAHSAPPSSVSSPRIKDWQILRQSHRRGDAINHSHQIVADPWNLKAFGQLRVKS